VPRGGCAVGKREEGVPSGVRGVGDGASGFAGDGHRGELDEETVPRLLLVRLQRLEAGRDGPSASAS